MKVSIWQQFSSNHSANYTVIGIFDSIEIAQKVTAQLKALITKISEEYQANQPQMVKNKWQLTSLEKEVAQSRDIEWTEPIDWVMYLFRLSNKKFDFHTLTPNEFIHQIDDCVFIHAPGFRTWQAGDQFVSYLESYGGIVYRDVYMGYSVNHDDPIFESVDITIRCKVPDAKTLNLLDDLFHIRQLGHIHQRFADSSHAEMPWIKYHPHYEKLEKSLTEEHFRNTVSFDVENIQREGNTIRFNGFTASEIAYALSTLTKWLRSLGCVVNYEFKLSQL